MKREMSVAGAFYPARDTELERYFEHFNTIYDESHKLPNIRCKAVIVPHAGYIYSGYTANIAYRLLQNTKIKEFVVIGPSHRIGFNGVSMCQASSYSTPFGDIPAASALRQELHDTFKLNSLIPHAEHSTEVQFPFLKYYMPDVNILELIYGKEDPGFISEIIDFVLGKEDTGVIISTDLSHFYDLQDANKLDRICLNAIDTLNPALLHNGCEACGEIGIEAMLLSAKTLNLQTQILDYRTSADASHDSQKVVGYVSACFY
ncbi:AmmeMemoRadiSam system protein B [bacterium]|nr:AmmeMemoRadiSam system protein B [bacterium]MBU1991028.1 AmmeMemoRadiSam system protein B [bacterium]